MTITAKTNEGRVAWRTAFCSGCGDYTETYLDENTENEECAYCGDDCTLFDSEGEYNEAARHDAELASWEADREEW
jgi:hypothetical protein